MLRFVRKQSFCLITIILCLSLSSCNIFHKQAKEQKQFDAFMNNLFIEEVKADSLSLNYSLAKPEDYGITDIQATLGEYSIDQMREELSVSENHLSSLSEYNYEKLTGDQQLTYDIVKEYLETGLILGDYTYYREILGPTTGIQAQLPILLAEYSFYERKDIDEYLDLLPCVYDYFEDISKFEREKSARGLFMNDDVAGRIIEQCNAFIADPENNFLIGYFNEKIEAYDDLTQKEKKNYEIANAIAVIDYVIPAYQLLIDTLSELTGTGTNNAGLYYYPKGKEYYEILTRYKTGSGKSMEEIIQMLDSAIDNGLIKMTALNLTDRKLMDKYSEFTSFPLTDPEDILSDLKKDIRKDFPSAVNVNCDIKYVPASLSDYLSPAMYLIPPIDNYENNNIYINGADKDILSMIYTTVAHEGYPGHMYQCVYFRSQNPSPIRNILDFTGYDEGWATYVELYSYQYAGIDENLADLLAANNVVILCMYARTDIGIHYQGWTKNTAVNYIKNYIDNTETAARIYSTLLEEPAIYLPYAIGYLEIDELKTKAEVTFGDDFVAKEFHQFLLDIGPAQFDIIENRMERWMAGETEQNNASRED